MADAQPTPMAVSAAESADSTAITRLSDGAALAQALQASRRDTLATFEAVQEGLAGAAVPPWPTLNPPLWELGHIGWFQAYWIARNPEVHLGTHADPNAPRRPGVHAQADALYDSSHVPHATRWQLPLPDAAGTQADLSRQLEQTLAQLAGVTAQNLQGPALDTALYAYRLALFHEDMHHEAALYMAQALGLTISDSRWQLQRLHGARTLLPFEPGPFTLGWAGPGFAFDNELGAHRVDLPATAIDSRVLSWDEYLPFVEAGGYEDARWWPGEAGEWRSANQTAAPRYLRRDRGDTTAPWSQWRHGRWAALDLREPACHLSAFEAQAWCLWAGRRLPTEAEWERAAVQAGSAFEWGAVWEWTASTFAPYPGFSPHPYRDYSAPWFGSRRVLRGASFMTQARMRHPRYRNFFTPERNDVPAGFRTCALIPA